MDVSSARRASARIARFYDERLAVFGDTAAGAGWPNAGDRTTRFDVMLDLVASLSSEPEIALCDLGCGTGELFARINERGLSDIRYSGVDISESTLGFARSKFPDVPFHRLDVLAASDQELEPLRCDVLVANGLFTVKSDLTHDEMWDYLTATLERIWPLARRGVAFNVMSVAVDRERDDLFHVSYDDLARFLHGLAGRSIGFRADYGLYEYVAYATKPATLPAYRARLPLAGALTPYLATLDRTRRYSNHGELVRRFESRVAEHLGLGRDETVSASSGTAAIVGAILGSAGRATDAAPYCLCPAYTFVGTASAIEQCGYRLHLVDVDPNDWSLDPDAVERHPRLAQAGLVVVVAPYGRMPSQERWAAFQRRTGIPVVIDAAAGFEALGERRAVAGTVPTVLSFQASKSFSTGEGGAVLCTDGDRATAIARALNFGFFGDRTSRGPSINGKMSEYHAAVGLAELDGWAVKRSGFGRVAADYARSERIVVSPLIASCYALFEARDLAESTAVRASLDALAIEHRLWYGGGLHREPAFASVERDRLDTTDDLAPRLIGLPTAPDLDASSIRRVVEAIARATGP